MSSALQQQSLFTFAWWHNLHQLVALVKLSNQGKLINAELGFKSYKLRLGHTALSIETSISIALCHEEMKYPLLSNSLVSFYLVEELDIVS